MTQIDAGEILRKGIIHRADPVAWMKDVCNITADDWQAKVLRTRGHSGRGARIACLAPRQSGKSSTIAGRVSHTAIYKKDRTGGPTTSLIAAPAERQGQLLLARAAELLDKDGHIDQRSQSRIILRNGAQIVALPMGSDAGATARGYTVSGCLVCDEFGYLPDPQEVLAVVAPMVTIHGADMVLISSASFEGDLWHRIVVQEEGNWDRFIITADMCPRLTPEVLDDLRGQLGPALYAREIENQFSAEGFSPIGLEGFRACRDTSTSFLDPMELMR